MKIGLIGNPNVGKSTIFNGLTGMHQHTGNWPGKTVGKMSGFKIYDGINYTFEDLPGTYSLLAHSKEEEVTRDFVYFSDYDALVIVCDASALERNLNLVLQVLEVTDKVVICVNLIDEAKKKKIVIDFDKLEKILKVPIVKTVARSNKGLDEIMEKLKDVCFKGNGNLKIKYDDIILDEMKKLYDLIPVCPVSKETISLRILSSDYDFINSFDFKYKTNLFNDLKIKKRKEEILANLKNKGIAANDIDTLVIEIINERCNDISNKVVKFLKKNYDEKDRIIDKWLTNKFSGTVIMLLLLFLILWITIVLANYPSNLLYALFFKFEKILFNFLVVCHLPKVVVNCLVYGVYRVLAWVVAVMLPPMAIFFPLFTLLEDLGYLPRIAFNLDGQFKKCSSCGKQALTMVMGFGCNAVGVTGARIIDSPRERLMAILTNTFVPCNGRFPLLLSLITMFLMTDNNSSFFRALILTLFILTSVLITFIVSKILSLTILKGIPSSFTLELPSYRRPQVGKVIVRSIFERTLFVLKRAVLISAPAGLIIWLFSNISINHITILQMFSHSLDGFGHWLGMDGVILVAFILGFPANEIVIPIMIMGYMSLGYITEMDNMGLLRNLFIKNGWTWVTAICVMLFSLMHFPCMTTLVTIKKETGRWKWTILAFLIPLIVGISLCFVFNLLCHLGRCFF
jgi:ferrous iron transport protein B